MPIVTDPSCPKCQNQRVRRGKKGKPLGEWYCSKCNYASNKCKRNRNREKYLSDKKKYYQSHKGEYAEYATAYNQNNKEAVRARRIDYHSRNRDQINCKSRIYRKEVRHPDYGIWSHFNQRCHNPKNSHWHLYGKRGIKVHLPWKGKKGFLQFIKDKGPRPEPRHLYSLDRWPDRNGDYTPENTRWALKKEQANNTRSNKDYKISIPDNSLTYYPYDNLITLKEFAEKVKLPLIVAKYRYAINWEVESMLGNDEGRRKYPWRNHSYTMNELCLISNIRFSVLHSRIYTRKWSIEKAMTTPSLRLKERS